MHLEIRRRLFDMIQEIIRRDVTVTRTQRYARFVFPKPRPGWKPYPDMVYDSPPSEE